MMKKVKRVLLAAMMVCSLSIAVLAADQRNDNQKPLPKESNPKVVNEPKKDKPQGNSNNQGNDQKKDDKKKP